MPGLAAAALAAAILSLLGCSSPGVPLPPQRPTWFGPERKPFGAFLRIADAHAEAAIVRGVRPEGRWAWMARHAEVRFWLPRARSYDFSANLYLAGQTLKETGPVAISIFVDGRRLGALRADEPREYNFAKPVPAGWVRADAPVTVAFETDRVWVSPDGTEYAFLLVSAGFQSQ